MPTKYDVVKALEIEKECDAFDFALPQQFFEYILLLDGNASQFVWYYGRTGEGFRIEGPRPLTRSAVNVLTEYNKKFGTDYRTDFNVWEGL